MVSLVAEPPPGFVTASELERRDVQPTLSGGAGSTYTQWRATRSPATDETLLAACVSTPIPGWVEDMRATVSARTTGMASAAAERVVGAPIEARPDERGGSGAFLLVAPGGGASPRQHGIARTFLGFDDGGVVTCFAACTSRVGSAGEDAGRACDASVRGARVEGGIAPPRPGLVLGSVTWAVHHPTRTAAGGAALIAGLGVVAVAWRRRPRSRV